MTADVWTAQVAQGYDAASADVYAPEVLGPTVDFLARRAGDRPALEFGIGTGRVALPLAARGVPVAGIELSEPMAAELRRKPGGHAIPVTIGDMATTTAPGRFGLVYAVYNALTLLLTQAEQVRCVRNAAAHLEPGGLLVAEVFVPQLQRLPPGETARPSRVSEHHLVFDVYDVVEQRVTSHHHVVADGRASTFRSPHRYVWPAELDLMARLAGLHRTERWAGWTGAPLTADSASAVSVWQKPAG
ncbi:class I SAM-dependent DNA methyltransferase [Geodermatophilus obscurus]|uniref:class I SAM-dependent DNA methyltransferase n=1 Tax=Geodermatophilus obscurus TaxID=1861 RepID=UPI0011603200|nr:class I SAM-dependent methyltransferase [Geodermatophilus obscurus]